MPGLTGTGLEVATLTELRAQINEALQNEFGISIDVSDRSIEGFVIGILSERLAIIWELVELINNSQDPDKATGAALEALCLLTGTFRSPATFSTVTLTLTGTPTTSVSTGALVSTTSTSQQFETLEDGLITLLDDWSAGADYAVDDRVTNAGNVYICITAGTAAGSGGPDTQDDDITDNTVHWRFLGVGTGAVDVEAQATVTGPIVAVSGDITTIDTPVGGWDGVMNILDAVVGEDVMSDAELRILREIELAEPGTATQAAIRAALIDVPDVTAVTVFVNDTDDEVDGMPPHSVEALVTGGEDQDIWDTLLANVAAGIKTWGDEVGTATDSQGTDHEERFTRPEELTVYIDITLIKDPETYPLDGDDQVKLAIVTWGNNQLTGKDIVASGISAQAFQVDGVLDVTATLIDTSPGPSTSTTIPVGLRQIAVYDISRIDVTSSDGTP
jgi:uncharacterized phage protein gp47/JayE